MDQPLAELPSSIEDSENPNLSVSRLLPNVVNFKKGDMACDMGDQAGKAGCLNGKLLDGRECMWVRVESRNPLLAIQDSRSYCLPCEMDGEEIPCWNVGAWVGGNQVTDCEMRCPHQKLVRQPQWACVDESGFITQSACWNKGTMSNSKCMWIAYETEEGESKTTCGPCEVEGTGGWACPAAGDPGPTGAGSKVSACLSQCDTICPGPPDCMPTVAPPPPPPPPSPGVIRTDSPKDEMLKAPLPIAMPTVNPYAVAQAAQQAAKAAGREIGTPPPPTNYYPVIMYRKPGDYMFTPGPPPSALAYPAPGLLQTDKEGSASKSNNKNVNRGIGGAQRHLATSEDEPGVLLSDEDVPVPPPAPAPAPPRKSFLTRAEGAMQRWGSR